MTDDHAGDVVTPMLQLQSESNNDEHPHPPQVKEVIIDDDDSNSSDSMKDEELTAVQIPVENVSLAATTADSERNPVPVRAEDADEHGDDINTNNVSISNSSISTTSTSTSQKINSKEETNGATIPSETDVSISEPTAMTKTSAKTKINLKEDSIQSPLPPPGKTTNSSITLSNSSKSKSSGSSHKSDGDEESRVATQMAAVAAAAIAATKNTASPSAAATYAKATIATLDDNTAKNNGENGPAIPVYLHLVRREIWKQLSLMERKQLESSTNSETPGEESFHLNTDALDDLNTKMTGKNCESDDTSSVPALMNDFSKEELSESRTIDEKSTNLDEPVDGDSICSDSRGLNNANSLSDRIVETISPAVGDEIVTSTATSLEVSLTSSEHINITTENSTEKNQPNLDDIDSSKAKNVSDSTMENDFTSKSDVSINEKNLKEKESIHRKGLIENQIAKGNNDSFLKYLLILTSHTCLVTEDTINTNIDSERKDQQQKPYSEKLDDEVHDFILDADKIIAVEAANKVVSILQNAEKSYDTLASLLASHHYKSIDGEQLTKRKDEVSSEDRIGENNDGGDIHEQEQQQDFEVEDVVPDLLPPCTSLSGDATIAFFRACSSASSHVEADQHQRYTSPTSSERDVAGTTSTRSATAPSTSSIVSSVISSVTGREVKQPSSSATTLISASGNNSLGGVFGKVRRTRKQQQPNEGPGDHRGENSITKPQTTSDAGQNSTHSSALTAEDQRGALSANAESDYTVTINQEMLGLTVENVLERTVVRTVLPGGAARRAGARVGSLIVKVGSVETANLTHFETIDELRQSQRPLKLVLRRIRKDALRGAREEMGRLVRGGGFGVVGNIGGTDGQSSGVVSTSDEKQVDQQKQPFKDDLFINMVHKYWFEGTKRALQLTTLTKKDEALSRAGAKLVWILSLLIIGLERQAVSVLDNEGRLSIDGTTDAETPSSPGTHKKSLPELNSKDFTDAAKSVSKILHDYAQKHFEGEPKSQSSTPVQTVDVIPNRKRSKQPLPPPHVLEKQMGGGISASSKRNGTPMDAVNASKTNSHSNSTLLWIGDVLHRARSFLADPSSPPAALLRGEVIALLHDILDIDSDMSLSEEESASSVAGRKAGPMNDLGSAGSLLKLIVLNCSMMRSPGCAIIVKKLKGENTDYKDSHKLHAGNRFLAVVHRLAASRSTSARVTACSLGPVLWGHLDFAHQLQLRGVITRALHDVEVVVRKSTATVLHDIAELVFDPRAVPWLVLMCERAMTDPEPQLRAAAMTLTWHLAEHLPNAFLGDASKGSRSLRRLPPRTDPTFAEVYLLQCKLLPVATRLAEDRAASVRLAVAAQCDRLSNALGEHWYSVIIDLLQALLGDSDERVRSEATLCVPRLVESVLLGTTRSASPNMSINVLGSLLPVTIKLLKDPGSSVRVSLATASGELLTLLVGLQSLEEISARDGTNSANNESDGLKRHKRHIDDTLIPLVQRLLHDSDPEVTSAALRAVTNASRGNVREISSRRNEITSETKTEDESPSISSHQSHTVERKEPVFIPVLSEKQVLRLLPTLSDLATSAQWRVRQSAVEIVPALLGCTYRLETRSEIAQLCVKLMGDSVDAVRKTAAECLCLGGGSLGGHGGNDGGEWITAIVIPHLLACKNSFDCKQRLLSLKMVEVILTNGVCPTIKHPMEDFVTSPVINRTSSLMRTILQMAASLSKDKIANVRLNVGRVFGKILNMLEKEDLVYITKVLEDQLADESSRPGGGDRDVIYFAKRAIGLAKDRLEEYL